MSKTPNAQSCIHDVAVRFAPNFPLCSEAAVPWEVLDRSGLSRRRYVKNASRLPLSSKVMIEINSASEILWTHLLWLHKA